VRKQRGGRRSAGGGRNGGDERERGWEGGERKDDGAITAAEAGGGAEGVDEGGIEGASMAMAAIVLAGEEAVEDLEERLAFVRWQLAELLKLAP
jgi:hypothetical protein